MKVSWDLEEITSEPVTSIALHDINHDHCYFTLTLPCQNYVENLRKRQGAYSFEERRMPGNQMNVKYSFFGETQRRKLWAISNAFMYVIVSRPLFVVIRTTGLFC